MRGSAVTCAHNLAELERLLSCRAYDEAQEWRHEWWCLWRLLCRSGMRFKIKFPINIQKRDPPDFYIEHGLQKVKVEITKATFQRYEQVKAERRKMRNPGLLELDLSLFDNQVLKKKDGVCAWRRYARASGEKLIGRGWAGNEPEDNLAGAVRTVLAKKASAPRDPFPDAKAWLFVDASDHIPGVRAQDVCQLLQRELRSSLRRFDVVALEFGGQKICWWDRSSL